MIWGGCVVYTPVGGEEVGREGKRERMIRVRGRVGSYWDMKRGFFI